LEAKNKMSGVFDKIKQNKAEWISNMKRGRSRVEVPPVSASSPSPT